MHFLKSNRPAIIDQLLSLREISTKGNSQSARGAHIHTYVCPDHEREYISLIIQVEKIILLSSNFFHQNVVKMITICDPLPLTCIAINMQLLI